jgi:carbonic anhydrase
MLFRVAALATCLLGAFTADAAGGTDWDYDHVELWGDKYPECNGKSNSPIALFTGECTSPEVDYKFYPGNCTIDDFKFYVTNNGVKMSINDGCTKPQVKIPNIAPKYEHLQTHIHLSSEHSIDGNFYGAEMHMVHQQMDGNGAFLGFAVTGTMIVPTAQANNPMFEAWLQRWVDYMNSEAVCESCWGAADIQPYDMNVYQGFIGKDFYHYSGGLTTPGCNEVVAWNFTTEPWEISVRQYQMLTELILDTKVPADDGTCDKITVASQGGSTSRPPQALNGRNVVKYCSFS